MEKMHAINETAKAVEDQKKAAEMEVRMTVRRIPGDTC
jgi:hypothetical protein